MTIFADTLRALAPLFFLMLLGAGLRRAGVLKSEHVPLLNGLVVNVTMPALVVHSLASAPSVPRATLWLPLPVFVAEIVTIVSAYACAKMLRLSDQRTGALMLAAPFGNTGFLGYPITLALFPHQFTSTILIDQIGMTIPLFVCAPLLGGVFSHKHEGAPVPHPKNKPVRKSKRGSALAYFHSPIFVALLVGVVLRLIPWPNPIRNSADARAIEGLIDQCLVYLGQGTVPLILLALGASLRPSAARAGLAPLATAAGLKLVVTPWVAWAVFRLLHIGGDMLTVGVMLAAMPTAVMAAVLVRHNQLDGDYGVGIVFVTTVLAAVALPLWIMAVR